jgi:hypothetical protein
MLLRWLHAVAGDAGTGRDLFGTLPPHCVDAVTQILRHCAGQWLATADQLDARLQPAPRLSVQPPKMHSCTPAGRQNQPAPDPPENAR